LKRTNSNTAATVVVIILLLLGSATLILPTLAGILYFTPMPLTTAIDLVTLIGLGSILLGAGLKW